MTGTLAWSIDGVRELASLDPDATPWRHAVLSITKRAKGFKKLARMGVVKVGPKGYIHGWVYVGPQAAVGEAIHNAEHGEGTIKDADKDSITVEHASGEVKHYGAAFTVSQKPKFVATGSAEGKTHIANVKSLKDGTIVNRDDDTVIGKTRKNADGTWSYKHEDDDEFTGAYKSKHLAVKDLVARHNELADSKSKVEDKPEDEAVEHAPHIEAEPEKPEEPETPEEPAAPAPAPAMATDYHGLGNLTSENTNLEENPEQSIGVVSAQDPTGGDKKTFIGVVVPGKPGGPYKTFIHGDGSSHPLDTGPGHASPQDQLLAYHNEHYGDATPAEPAAPKEPKDVGAISHSDLEPSDPAYDADKYGISDVIHAPTGTIVGSIEHYQGSDGNHYYGTILPDGTATPVTDSESKALGDLTDEHNALHGGDISAEPEPAPSVPDSPAVKKPYVDEHGQTLPDHLGPDDAYTNAIDDNTLGVFAKGTHAQVGMVHLDDDGDAEGYTHVADGVYHPLPEDTTSSQAKDVLLMHHNVTHAAFGDDEEHAPAQSLTHDEPGPAVGHVTASEGDAAHAALGAGDGPKYHGVGEVTSLTLSTNGDGEIIHTPTGHVLGYSKPNSDGTYTVSHVDGTVLSSKVVGPKGAALEVGLHHNVAVEEHPNTIAPTVSGTAVPSTAHETIGPLGLGDVSKHITPTGYDIHDKDGTKVGSIDFNQATSQGYSSVTHADGTVTPVNQHTSNGAANMLLEYHNEKYGTPKVPETPEYAKTGHVNANLVDKKLTSSGFDVSTSTGTKIGSIDFKPGAGQGYGSFTHADGTKTPIDEYTSAGASKELVGYHNTTYAKPGSNPAAAAVTPSAKEGPKPWMGAGAQLTPAHVTAKKTGEIVDKKTGVQVGTLQKNHLGSWEAVHASGAKPFSGSSLKKDKLTALLNEHNKTVGVHSAVKLGQGGDVAAGEKLSAGGLTFNPVSGEFTKYGTSEVVGNADKNADGTIMMHDKLSGASWAHNGPIGTYSAKGDFATGHNSAVDRAKGVSGAAAAHTTSAPVKATQAVQGITPLPPGGKYTTAHSPLSQVEKNSIHSYTTNAFSKYNLPLAQAKTNGDEIPSDPVSADVHKALDKNEIADDMTIWRGIKDAEGQFGPVGSQVGKVGIQHSFMSTTVDHSIAKSFGNNGEYGGAVITMHVPKGAKAAHVQSISQYGHEGEILFQHGTVYKVNSDQIVNGRRLVDVTVVGLSHKDGNHEIYKETTA